MADVPEVAGREVPEVHFDHYSVEHAHGWRGGFAEMRRTCPVAHSDAWDGFYVLTRYEDGQAALRDYRTFSSAREVAGNTKGGAVLPAVPNIDGVPNIPADLDPPDHAYIRRVLSPWFSAAITEERWGPYFRELVTALIDEKIESGRIDLLNDLAVPAIGIVSMKMLGLSLADWRTYAPVYHRLVHTRPDTPEWVEIRKGSAGLNQLIWQEVRARQTEPRDDMLSSLMTATFDGVPITPELTVSAANVVLGAANSTTAATVSHMFYWLDVSPDDRRRLIEDPSVIPNAREEMIRHFAPAQVAARTVKEPTVTPSGYQLTPGVRVLISIASANNDEDTWDDPDRVDFDRDTRRHLGFGMGVHRCLGIHVARAFLETMISEVLRRLPDYEVDRDAMKRYDSVGFSNGWITLPATFSPGPRLGSTVDLEFTS